MPVGWRSWSGWRRRGPTSPACKRSRRGMRPSQPRRSRMQATAPSGMGSVRTMAWLPQAEEASAGSEAAARKERMKERTPRVDWAELLKRTFDFDVFACMRCGGRLESLGVREGRDSKQPSGPSPCHAPDGSALWAGVYLTGLRRLSTGREHHSGGPVSGPPRPLGPLPPPQLGPHSSYALSAPHRRTEAPRSLRL